MLFLTSFSSTGGCSGGGSNGCHRQPLTPTEFSPTSHSLNMGALCWVLPLEEDEEMLEEEDEEGGEVFPGVRLAEQMVGLLHEASCCLSCQRPDDSLVLLVNRVRVRLQAVGVCLFMFVVVTQDLYQLVLVKMQTLSKCLKVILTVF